MVRCSKNQLRPDRGSARKAESLMFNSCRLQGASALTACAMSHTLIASLDLSPHPEGGWYRETMRQPSPDGSRGLATAILFLLEDGQRS
ncbi:cupin domain-containing protein, partial [Pseudomonas sp. EL_65y_Pfl2_R96]|uniref:cupin domain-containing protein n=1 Tax=Pseudomonas sp. EL_65y_Pfl2_R96 TaxID=3088699 RepID=UPI00403F4013